MKALEQFNTALEMGFAKAVFDHLRNFLMCSFLLAVGANEFREHTGMFFGLIPSLYAGSGVMGLSFILILLNLYDGIRNISGSKYHLILTIGLVTIYLLLSAAIVEMAWNFRVVNGVIR